MAASMTQTPPESYWNSQSKTLRRVQDGKTSDPQMRNPAGGRPAFQPLSDKHPLLHGSTDNQSSKSPRTHRSSPHRQSNGTTGTPPLPRGRHSRTPPSRLPRMHTPPDHRHEARVRGARFDILPHVRNQPNGYQNGYDSWGEEVDSDSDSDYGLYPSNPRGGGGGFPYPVVMYPMVVPQPQRRKTKDKGKKKRVRYKASPVMLNSRENTLHEPLAIHDAYSTFAYEDENRLGYDPYDEGIGGGGAGYSNSPRFSYISTGAGHKYNPFDPRMNPVLARYQMGGETRPVDNPPVRHRPLSISPSGPRAESLSALRYLDTNPLFSKILTESMLQNYLLEDILPDVLNEVVLEGLEPDKSLPPVPRDRTPQYESETSFPSDAAQLSSLERFLGEVLEEVVTEGATEVVRDTMLTMVDTHLERAAVYDIAVDIMNETIEAEAPELISDLLADLFLEELLEECVVEPEVEDLTRDIVTDVCTNYNDRRRRQDLKLVKRDTGERLLDGLTLDYLLALSARQGKIWTEGEHANKLFDSMILNTLLAQMMDVSGKRRSHVTSKPVRRHQEKMVTDVATDVILEELCKTLDEDMADLDEYEMGMENTDRRQKFSPLEKWIRGS